MSFVFVGGGAVRAAADALELERAIYELYVSSENAKYKPLPVWVCNGKSGYNKSDRKRNRKNRWR